MRLEKGYDTEVGERGSRLSTGQKQLVSFARAILANPRMFVLDEATSSVDTETEQLIQEAIHKVLNGRTSFIIAHRLSTIRSADRILVIEKGRVIEEGTHKQLLQKKGYYYRLYTNQFMDVNRLSRREIESDLDESLKALGTDVIDIYWLHRDDTSYPVEDIMQTLSLLAEKGKVRAVGCSNWGTARIEEANRAAKKNHFNPFSASQIQWSLAASTPEAHAGIIP